MTSKEKAEELYLKYHNLWINGNSILAKVCASIAVDEIIKEKNGCSKYECYGQDINWNEVKKEIENL
jgi:hypothetical protein